MKTGRLRGFFGFPLMKLKLSSCFLAAMALLVLFLPCEARQKTLEQDTDKDGKVDRILRFGEDGKIAVQEIDSNGDGVMDRFQYYKNEQIVRLESDSDHDGKVDQRDFFKKGKRTRHEKISGESGRVTEIIEFDGQERPLKIQRDTDGDGRYELTQWFDRPPWSAVMEVDRLATGKPQARCFYQGKILRLKEVDESGDGKIDLREHYDERGNLTRSEERFESMDHLDITWFYDEEGQAFRAERDRDGDSRPDMWLYYEKGRLIRLEEDTDGDGKPDLWEDYDRSETLVKRSRDLNRDGVPDAVEENKR